MRARVETLLAVFLLVTFLPAGGVAGGILHVFPPRLKDRAFAVARPTLLFSSATLTVSEDRIVHKIDQRFLNDNEFPLEGVFLLPMEKSIRPMGVDVRLDGARCPYRIVSSDEFFPLLKKLTLSMRDPSLLGLAGKDVLLIRPVNVGIGRQKSFRIQYEYPVSVSNEQLNLHIPMAGERYSLGPIGDLEIRVRFKMSRTIRSVFSPTHHVTVLREAPHRCLVSLRSRDRKVRHDFRLLTTFSRKDLNLRMFSHRLPNETGSFMAFIEPPLLPATRNEPRKDVAFLLDVSGSMSKTGFEHAKSVIVSGLERLRTGDRFNVMTIGTKPGRLEDRLVPASQENILRAVRFVNSRKCEGGTDLYNGLITALELFRSRRRPNLVLLVSDGRSTVGVTSPETLVEHVTKNNRVKARVFAFAVGNTADVALLDRLATSTKGVSVHLSGNDDFVSVMKRFLSGISPPKVSNLSLNFQGISVKDVVPSPIPDLFGPESVVVLGRYVDETGDVPQATLRGKVRGRVSMVTKPLDFPKVSHEYPFISQIWAMRRMARLAEQSRLEGSQEDVAGKAASLAKEFGFISPVAFSHLGLSHHDRSSVTQSGKLLWRFKTSFVPYDVTSSAFRNVNGKVFCRSESGWVDTAYRPEMATTNLEFLSDQYFSQLKTTPQMGTYLALSPEITLVHDRSAMRILDDPILKEKVSHEGMPNQEW
jgi:Ca-activated chloride channel family protein